VNTNFSHQSYLFHPQYARPVVIIGVGAIGSMVAFALAKMGVTNITVIDGDTVASHNVPMSLYRSGDLGRLKVEALAEVIAFTTGVTIKTVPEFYVGQSLRRATIIACVDTMAARKVIWQQVKGQVTVDLFIDTRTAEAYAEVYAISPRLPEEREYYEGLLYPDEEAARQTCGRHGIVFVSLGVAASVSATVARFWQSSQKKRCHAVRCDIPGEVQL
jgi:hypothetical protein